MGGNFEMALLLPDEQKRNKKVNESVFFSFFFQAEDGIRDADVTGVQTCALPISFRGMLDAWVRCIRAGGKIMFFGNGGSAGDAQHLATELVVRYRQDRVPIAGLARSGERRVGKEGRSRWSPYH